MFEIRAVFVFEGIVESMQQTRAGYRRGAPRSPRVGRPPRITRRDIAQAASEIGLADLTLKAVAEKLGVSVAGLYHHIDGKDDLLHLAAEYSASQAAPPENRGQHWAVWLIEWAIYTRNAFVSEPGLLPQYVDGAVSAEAIADNVEVILGVLVDQGFGVRDALEAYSLVSSMAVGSAINALHEEGCTRRGRPRVAEYHRVLAQRGPDELPNLRALVTEMARRPPPTFIDHVTKVLMTIAVDKGDNPSVVKRKIRSAKLEEPLGAG
jgi:AcrR family transcriptional regulator